MSTKVFPYSPRSPSSKYEDNSASAKSIDTDWSGDELENTLDSAGSTPHQKVKKGKRNSVDLAKLKKSQQSPRRNERGVSSKNGSARNTPRSARRDESDDDASTITTSTKPPLSRSNSQKVKKKPVKKKGVTFRVPLEDRHTYDLTAESYLHDMSMNEDEFEKKVIPAAKPPTAREIRRMNNDRRKKHQKGILPSLARCCIS